MGINYPEIPRRYVATIIDGMFVLCMFILTAYFFQGDDKGAVWYRLCITFIFLFIYEPLCTSRLYTIGQWLMRIRVRDYETLDKISIPAAYARLFVKIILGSISFLTIPIDSAKRGIHDIVAGSIVIMKE